MEVPTNGRHLPAPRALFCAPCNATWGVVPAAGRLHAMHGHGVQATPFQTAEQPASGRH